VELDREAGTPESRAGRLRRSWCGPHSSTGSACRAGPPRPWPVPNRQCHERDCQNPLHATDRRRPGTSGNRAR
jgi:hypothetical protein